MGVLVLGGSNGGGVAGVPIAKLPRFFFFIFFTLVQAKYFSLGYVRLNYDSYRVILASC